VYSALPHHKEVKIFIERIQIIENQNHPVPFPQNQHYKNKAHQEKPIPNSQFPWQKKHYHPDKK
jgi:hypothetical protein